MNYNCNPFRTAFLITLTFFVANLNPANAQICNCSDVVYLNEIPTDGIGTVHKYEVESDGTLTEIFSEDGITPWYVGPELPSPHGLGVDNNGFLYIGAQARPSDIRKLTCDGELLPTSEFVLPTAGQFNIVTLGENIYSNDRSVSII